MGNTIERMIRINIQTIFDYLSELAANNNREWYHKNKVQYKNANNEFENLLQTLIYEIGKTDSSVIHSVPKNITFKVVRDTRYSADKSPYNPAFRAHISSSTVKLPIPVGYFIRIKPNGQSFLGGGLFADMFKDATTMIRDYIVLRSDEWESIITAPSFSKLFVVKGEALKNVPRGYGKEHRQSEYLKNKSWYLEHFISDEQVLSDDFIEKATEVFLKMKPFNDFLNTALKDFKMPKRP